MSDAPNSLPTPPAKRGRGRPRKDSNWATFSRDELAARALHIAGNEGFSAVTMHRLAAEFSVTPRALYNYVADRQEIINLAVAQFWKRLRSSILIRRTGVIPWAKPITAHVRSIGCSHAPPWWEWKKV